MLLLPTKLFLIVARILRGLQAHCRVCGSRGKRRLATTVQQGIRTGEIRANTDRRRIANILIATLEGSLLLSRLEGTRTAFLNVRATLDLMPGALRALPKSYPHSMRTKHLILAVAFLAILGLIFFQHPTPTREIALTFDDLPVHGDLPPGESRLQVIGNILATLQREHMPPTYGFLNGSPVENDPALLDTLKAWRAAGQPLANHTWSHSALSAVAPNQFEADITRNEPLLQSLMGKQDWHYLRYPYLDEGDTSAKRQAVRTWLQEHHYQVAQVTQDFGDYLWNLPFVRYATEHNDSAIATLEASYLGAADRQLTQAQAISRLRYGREIPFVVLLHAGAFDAHVLPELIALYRRHGLAFVTLQQAQSDPAYRGNPAATLRLGASILNRFTSLRNRLTHAHHPGP